MQYNIPRLHSITSSATAITFKSVTGFLYVLFWGWLLLVAYTGWGRFLAKLLHFKLPAAVSCSLGIAIVVLLGGILNLAHAIYSSLLVALAITGLALYIYCRGNAPEAYRWRSFWKQAGPASRALLIAAIIIFCARAVGTVRMGEFYIPDDSAAYLVFPQKMLAAHTFAPDPFSERRLTSDLGAPYFLQSIVIAGTSLPHIGIADGGLGLVLLAAILFELGIDFKLSVFQIALLEFLACLVPQETFNLTFVILPIALLLGMTWMIWQAIEGGHAHSLPYSLLAGVIAGSIISLKSTYLPMVGSLLLLPFVLLLGRKNLKFSLQLFLAGVVGIALAIAAWMVSMKETGGTYLFPLLGRGVDYSRLHLFHSASQFLTDRSIGKALIQGAALLGLCCIQFVSDPKKKESRFGVSVLLSAALAITALNYTTGSDSIWRYNFPQFFSAIIVFYLTAASLSSQFGSSRRHRFSFYAGVIALLSMVFYYDISGSRHEAFRQVRWEFTKYKVSLRAALSGRPLASSFLRARYRQIEGSIPEQSVSLENVAYPFLFNYKNRKIFVMDWPGAAAPLPGWPFGKRPGAVAQYLRDNSVDYVIHDRDYSLHSDAMACQVLEQRSHYSEWFLEQVWLNTLVDIQLNELTKHYHPIYDDGKIVVIDLANPMGGSVAKESKWPVDASVSAVCSQIAKRYMQTRIVSAGTVADIE